MYMQQISKCNACDQKYFLIQLQHKVHYERFIAQTILANLFIIIAKLKTSLVTLLRCLVLRNYFIPTFTT